MSVAETIADLRSFLDETKKRSSRVGSLLRLADEELTRVALHEDVAFLTARQNKISTALSSLDDLVMHGYPDIPKLVLTKEQGDDILVDLGLIQDSVESDVKIDLVGSDKVSVDVGMQRST